MTNTNFKRFLVDEPIQQNVSGARVQNITFPPLTYMSNDHVPEVKFYVEFGWVWGMPQPNPYDREQVGEYDEIMLNVGGNCRDPENLGVEIEYNLGGQVLNIDSTSAIFIPRGVPHGPLAYKSFNAPHVRISLLIGTGEPSKKDGTGISGSVESAVEYQSDTDYAKYLVPKPVYEVIAETPIKNRQGPSSMTLMSDKLVPGSNIYIEGGWVWGMPEPNPHIMEHVHDYEELVLHFGSDYSKPNDLGGEIDFYVGGQPLTLEKTAMVYVPKSIPHGPLIWKKYSAPHLEMAIIPGAGTLNDADPGGHREKMKIREKGA